MGSEGSSRGCGAVSSGSGTLQTWESGKRLNDEFSGPQWARNLDFGLSAVGDTLLAAGLIGAAAGGTATIWGAGFGAIPGLAVAGAGGVLKGASALLKVAVKTAVKVSSKVSAKASSFIESRPFQRYAAVRLLISPLPVRL